MDEITILQAEVLKTLASPRRLEILALARGPTEVGRLARASGEANPQTCRSSFGCCVARVSSRQNAMAVRFAIAYRTPTSWLPAPSCAPSSNGALPVSA